MSRPAPYPADVRAKGWRFELDHERIRKSDTWVLAPADMRPWLLMLWMTAWEQTPCGSLPAMDELIAAHIGMPSKAFIKNKVALMRGWWLADDGRLYHDTLTERVNEMMGAKDKERTRKAAYRLRQSQGADASSHVSPEMSHGTTSGQTPDSHGIDPGRDDTGTGTGTSSSSLRSEQSSPAASASAKPAKAKKGYTDEFEEAWAAYPSRPGASKSEAFKAWNARLAANERVDVMLDGIRRYAAYCEAERTESRFIKHAATFLGPDLHYRSNWTASSRSPAASSETPYQRQARERAAAFAPGIAKHAPAAGMTPFTIDMEDPHVPALESR